MLILADENIPCVREAFATLGDVLTLPGRRIGPDDLDSAEVLLVRSVTNVDRALLAGSNVRYVGSATAGADHVDVDYLRAAGIGFGYAPGANAVSAAEYVIAALQALAKDQRLSLTGKTAGIIGSGNVGARVAERLEALGIACLINDPPLAERTGRRDLVNLQTIAAADLVTVHVPLTLDGKHSTRHLLGAGFFYGMKPGAIFINTSRGAVVDERGLKEILRQRPDIHLLLDVWDHEPDIDIELLQRAAIATPHIAGYSLDGKLRGADVIYRAACHYFGATPGWDMRDCLPNLEVATLSPSPQTGDDEVLRQAVLRVYDPRADDARLRRMLSLPAARRGALFDELRKNYPPRREFESLPIRLSADRESLGAKLQTLGFRVRLHQS